MSASLNKDILLAMSVPPFWHCGRTVRGNSLHTLAALAPALLMSMLLWGLPSLRVAALAMFTSMLTEFLCQKAMHRRCTQDDGTAAVTGMAFAFLLPAGAPWWLVVTGAAMGMGLGRMAFGGFGSNPVNAALVGWALVFVSFPAHMDAMSTMLMAEYADPLFRLKYFGADAVADIPLWQLLAGLQLGGLGSSQAGLLFLGGIYLIFRGVIRWEIASSFLLGTFITAGCFWAADPSQYASPLFHICTGSTMLAAFFLATEDSCCPHRRLPMFLYGLVGGALVVIIRIFGIYTDGAPFAVMLINLLAPMFGLVKTRPFGMRKGGKR